MKALKAQAGALQRNPVRYPYMLVPLDFKVNPSFEVVVAVEGEGAVREVAEGLWRSYTPARVTLWKPPGTRLERAAPHLKSMPPIGGKPTIYVCMEGVCSLPTHDPEKAARYMEARYRPRRRGESAAGEAG